MSPELLYAARYILRVVQQPLPEKARPDTALDAPRRRAPRALWIALVGALAATAITTIATIDRRKATDTAAPSAGVPSAPPERGRDDNAPPASAQRAPLALPDTAGEFVAGPQTTEADYVRRSYVRGAAIVTVTFERAPVDPGDYDRWVKNSPDSTQAKLELPASDAHGFYDCGDPAAPKCALIVRLRSGFRFEIRGFGDAKRPDLDAVARGLGLATLASRFAER